MVTKRLRTRHVVMLSGGVGSWCVARRVVGQHGPDDVVLLFADTQMEDEDLYRFLEDIEVDLGVPITRIADGRNPWEVFRDQRFLGNSRVDPCSRVLKRELMRAWLEEHCHPDLTRVYLGIDFYEIHRIDKARPLWEPWPVFAPLAEEPPYMDKNDMLAALQESGIEVPRLYKMGFAHNNCGGFCVKAGNGQFKQLLLTMPERYAWHEAQENALRDELGEVSVMVTRRKEDLAPGQKRRPMSMTEFRQRVETGTDYTTAADNTCAACVI